MGDYWGLFQNTFNANSPRIKKNPHIFVNINSSNCGSENKLWDSKHKVAPWEMFKAKQKFGWIHQITKAKRYGEVKTAANVRRYKVHTVHLLRKVHAPRFYIKLVTLTEIVWVNPQTLSLAASDKSDKCHRWKWSLLWHAFWPWRCFISWKNDWFETLSVNTERVQSGRTQVCPLNIHTHIWHIYIKLLIVFWRLIFPKY